MVLKPATGIEALAFEPRDVGVFTIPDVRTKVTTVQNYFFPRLEMLLRHTLDIVRQVYGVDPCERMTFAYRPSNRRASRTLTTFDFDEAYIGICGKRDYHRDLAITRSNGKPFRLFPTYLTYTVLPEGSLYVKLLPFRQDVPASFVDRVAEMVVYHLDRLEPLLLANHISHASAALGVPLAHAFRSWVADSVGISLGSSKCYFPVQKGRGLSSSLMRLWLCILSLRRSCHLLRASHTPCRACLTRFGSGTGILQMRATRIRLQKGLR